MGGLTTGQDGALWFTSTTQDKVGRMTTCGDLTEFALRNGFRPTRLIAAHGDLYVAGGVGSHEVARMSPGGTTSYISMPGQPTGLVLGPDGAVWVSEQLYSARDADYIARIATDGSVSEIKLPPMGSGAQCGWQCPTDITVGGDGNLWFTEGLGQGGVGIGQLSTAGTYMQHTLPDPPNLPLAITTAKNGSVWFTESRGRNVGRVAMDGTLTEFAVPVSDATYTPAIAASPDGTTWVCISRAGVGVSNPPPGPIGHIDASGHIDVIDTPGTGQPSAITVGPDGRVWFGDGSALFAYHP